MSEHVQEISASSCGSLLRPPSHASSISQQRDEHMPKISLLSELEKMIYAFSLHSQGKRDRDMEMPFGEFLSFLKFWIQQKIEVW